MHTLCSATLCNMRDIARECRHWKVLQRFLTPHARGDFTFTIHSTSRESLHWVKAAGNKF